jgi:hypothetical protein
MFKSLNTLDNTNNKVVLGINNFVNLLIFFYFSLLS